MWRYTFIRDINVLERIFLTTWPIINSSISSLIIIDKREIRSLFSFVYNIDSSFRNENKTISDRVFWLEKASFIIIFFFFFKERINGNRRESIVGRGVADAFTCDCWQNHFDGNTCAWHMLYPFFTSFFFFFLFVSSQLQLKFFFGAQRTGSQQ